MPGIPPYTVRSGMSDASDERIDSLKSAIRLASESMDSADDAVEIIDSTSRIVFDQPELVDRIMEHRKQRSARLHMMQLTTKSRP